MATLSTEAAVDSKAKVPRSAAKTAAFSLAFPLSSPARRIRRQDMQTQRVTGNEPPVGGTAAAFPGSQS